MSPQWSKNVKLYRASHIHFYVEEKFRQKLSGQEQMYLAIHLHRILSDVIASEEDNQG